MKAISPELVLVDDTLASFASEGSCDAVGDSAGTRAPQQTQLRSPSEGELARREWLRRPEAGSHPPMRRTRRPLAVAVSLALIALPFALVFEHLAHSQASESLSSASVTATSRTAPTEPRAEGRPHPSELRWRPLAGAAFYNVILWHGQTRALDLWPRKAVVDLSARPLPSGMYRWFVYPALDTGRGQRYGELIAHGTVRVRG